MDGRARGRWSIGRPDVVRDAVGIGLAAGAYAISFGAISVASGLTLAQTAVLSSLMFTGASQFAFVAAVAGGATPLAGAATAVLLGSRNAMYGLAVADLLRVRGGRRAAAAHLVIDETTAMALNHDDDHVARYAFVATGVILFVLWNLGTLVGAVGASAIASPETLGLDAAVPAAFIGLLAPRLRERRTWAIALAGAAVALVLAPITPAGIPVLGATAVAVAFGVRAPRGDA